MMIGHLKNTKHFLVFSHLRIFFRFFRRIDSRGFVRFRYLECWAVIAFAHYCVMLGGGGLAQKYVEPGGTLGHHDKERADKL